MNEQEMWDYHFRMPVGNHERVQAIASKYKVKKTVLINLMIARSLPELEQFGSLGEYMNGQRNANN